MLPSERKEQLAFDRLKRAQPDHKDYMAKRHDVLFDDFIQLDAVASSQRKLDKLTKSIDSDVKSIRGEVDTAKVEINKMKVENISFRAKQIEVIGVMVAFFTFISVQVQIFSNVDTRFFFPLSLLFLAALLLFIVIMSIVNLVRVEDFNKKFYVPVVLLGVVAVMMLYLGVDMYNSALSKMSVCEAGGRDFIMRQITTDELNKISAGDKLAIEKLRGLQLKLDTLGCNR